MDTTLTASRGSATERSFTGGVSLAVLYWMELLYLSVAFKAVRQQGDSKEDVWWIWADSEVRGPFSFTEVLKEVLNGSECISIVHHSRASEDPTPWKTIYYQSWWSNNLIARLWSVAFWFTLAVLGWIVLTRTLPWGSHRLVDAAYWLAVACIIIKRKSLRLWLDGLRAKFAFEKNRKVLDSRPARYLEPTRSEVLS